MTPIRLACLAAVLALGACDEPAPHRRPPPPAPAPAAATAEVAPGTERAGPVAWDASEGVFVRDGAPLKAARLWTFKTSAEDWAGAGAQISAASQGGLSVRNIGGDPILLSPAGLNLDGAASPQVIVRLTRIKAGGDWSAALFWTTAAHGFSEDFRNSPADMAVPAVNETVVLVYDMGRPKAGGGDWTSSRIDQIRLDTADGAGGEFVIHQIAIAGG